MKKRLISGIIVGVLLLFNSTICFAAEYAYSYGMLYHGVGEINTSKDAQDAATEFGIAGYSSYYNTYPKWSYVNGLNPNTNDYRIKSQIFFFSGHGTGGRILFHPYETMAEQENFHITTNFTQPTSKNSLRLSNFSLTNVKLMTFGACNSANNDAGYPQTRGNLIDTAVSRGAKTAVGWTVSVGTASHTAWLKRYTGELALGQSVQQAIDYANAFDYSDPNVEKYRVAGNKDLKISSYSATLFSSNLNADNMKINIVDGNNIYTQNGVTKGISFDENLKEELKININNVDINRIEKLLSKYTNIKIKKVNFRISVESINDNQYVIKMIETIGDIDTNSRIIINVNDGNIRSIFDSTKDIKIKNDSFYKNMIKKEIKEKAKNKLKEKISNEKEFKIISEDEKIYYDCEKNQFVYALYYDIKQTVQEYDDRYIYLINAITGDEIAE